MAFHSLKVDRLPSLGKPGDVYYVNPGGTVYMAASDGVLVCLSDMVQRGAEMPRAVGPCGEKGLTGPAGPVGPAGSNGRDGKQGARGETGPRGENGKDGKDGAPGPKGDIGAAGRDGVVVHDFTPETLARISEVEFKLNALLDQNAKGARYIQWLKEQVSGK